MKPLLRNFALCLCAVCSPLLLGACSSDSVTGFTEGAQGHYQLIGSSDDGLYRLRCDSTDGSGRLIRRPFQNTPASASLLPKDAYNTVEVWGQATGALLCPKGKPIDPDGFAEKQEAVRSLINNPPKGENKYSQPGVR